MSLSEKLINDLKEALKNKQERRLSAIRFLRSLVQRREIDKRVPLTDEEILDIIQKNIKQRKEVFPNYERMNRQDLLEKEKEEVAVLEKYLPQQLSKEELQVIVDEAIKETGAATPRDIGKVMGVLMPKVKGKADGKLVGELVKARLQPPAA
ncbi:aspartyl-tRNA amidotransferase [Candidatus Desantisbacteria bacterium CG_4_10_14_0_8_um_filter_48_22]|uniref:Aspartyl-tRNA amidotransferase n=1 Tax=Candidatus Desantisbacteria bacterium CG_4_10_14_0_8_um_filter_48_22 TaxID=1974543 RepID=A0A2M7SEM8_9BACT|nr:MAG: aspartyl-tRNA amidotransferase [Candidatus Desantisbacteria bacterium CG1_02_49_89]PIZ17982.1 MAG: aspartyl-tRNA amidotransferase [Candidatus Desantisbacteria bacterium CG_4_10_14_0_8_um_filter_48_22]PJB28517.1 MAG: aspartyl-tRNA amidotransferase [Candidatus Desantisbacteria bacterium CG_4_9_14_3_um_filter_50_7]